MIKGQFATMFKLAGGTFTRYHIKKQEILL
jgi:hypothetical protein